MVFYTVLFVLFATGGRPLADLIPDPSAIDAATGFMAVDDKAMRDKSRSRLIWVAEACRTQLKWYREHLAELARRNPELMLREDAPFLLSDEGRPIPLTRDALRSQLRVGNRSFPSNAGRHYLRSNLLGRVSSETLHAFLGHWHLGIEPWNEKAAFDPLRYRAELMAVMPGLLETAGWRPIAGLR